MLMYIKLLRNHLAHSKHSKRINYFKKLKETQESSHTANQRVIKSPPKHLAQCFSRCRLLLGKKQDNMLTCHSSANCSKGFCVFALTFCIYLIRVQ